MMDNNAKSKEEIQEELHRMIELKNQPVDPIETSHEQFDPAVREKVSEAVKRSIQNKISSIVNEAIKTAEEDERYYGEKIPARPGKTLITSPGNPWNSSRSASSPTSLHMLRQRTRPTTRAPISAQK